MSNSFNLMDENPNLGNGSNGCLCSELGNADTKGPFLVWASTETDNIFAPFPVLCANCAVRAANLIPQPGGGEKSAPKRKQFASVAEKRRVENRRADPFDEDGPSI